MADKPEKPEIPGKHALREKLRKLDITLMQDTLLDKASTRKLLGLLLGMIEEKKDEVRSLAARLSQVEEMALFDADTDLPNKRSFEQQFGDMIARRQRRGRKKATPPTAITAVMLDINWMKLINHISHNAGDAALRHVADILKSKETLREGDIIARVGDTKADEFAIVMYDATREQAETHMQKLTEQIRNTPCNYAGQNIPVSVAFGVHELLPNDTVETVRDATSRKMRDNKEHMKETAEMRADLAEIVRLGLGSLNTRHTDRAADAGEETTPSL